MSNIVNWMKRPSIAKKLILSFLLILTVPIIVLSYSAYQTAESSASIQDIAASAEEQLASMEEISASSTTLAELAEELRDLTRKFKIE
ncbi:hypothetical protein DT075_09450 [Bacillus licheniformis]|nr:hypothetical protein DT075_09450 [Bacillus licheniformis]